MYQLSKIISHPIFLFHVISEDISALQKFEYRFCLTSSFYQFLDRLIKINLTTCVIKCVSVFFFLYFFQETISRSTCVTHSELSQSVLHYCPIGFFSSISFFPSISWPSPFELKYPKLVYSSASESCQNLFAVRNTFLPEGLFSSNWCCFFPPSLQGPFDSTFALFFLHPGPGCSS